MPMYLNKFVFIVALFTMLQGVSINAAAATDPSKRYQHAGAISSVDQIDRTMVISGKTYKAAVGMQLENVPKEHSYSGVKFLVPDLNVYFNVERGTENNAIPSIVKMWLIPN